MVTGMFVAPATVGREEQAIRQARADRLDETIQTVSASLLGVTMGCARCHNHKFDPIPQKDYYALEAVFQGVEYGPRPWRNMPGATERGQRAEALHEKLEELRQQMQMRAPSWTEEWPSHLQTHFTPVKRPGRAMTFPEKPPAVVDEFEIYGAATGVKNLAAASAGAHARSSKAQEALTREMANVIDGHFGRTFAWTLPRELGEKEPRSPWLEIDLPAEAVIDRISISTDREDAGTTDYLIEPGKATASGPRKYRVEVRGADGAWHVGNRPSSSTSLSRSCSGKSCRRARA